MTVGNAAGALSGKIENMSETPHQNGRLPHGITREVLERDELRAAIHQLHPELKLNSDDVLRESISDVLKAAPPEADVIDGIWVFGYGSLLWNPCVPVAEWRLARIYGHHRDFRIRLTHGRGSPDAPGLMLGLDPGGSCTGMGLRIDVADLEHELLMVWRREMLSGVYRPTWVWLRTDAGRLPAVTFVTDRLGGSYCSRLAEADMVQLLTTGHGLLGSCAEYLANTVAHLDEQGIYDRHLHVLKRRVMG